MYEIQKVPADSVEKDKEKLQKMKQDKFFQVDEVIQGVKLADTEKTNWRRIRGSPLVRNIMYNAYRSQRNIDST